MNHLFISYSSVDGKDFAIWLADQLAQANPSIKGWVDRRELPPGYHWDDQIVEAIKSCECLLYILTTDSVTPHSKCKQEWHRALKYKKSVIPLQVEVQAELPYLLEPRQVIDFTKNRQAGLEELYRFLQSRATPQGTKRELEWRLGAAEYDLRRASDDSETARIQAEIEQLKSQIAELQHQINEPPAYVSRVEPVIQAGPEPDHLAIHPAIRTGARFINPPPITAPSYFQDRYFENKEISRFLRAPSKRLLIIIGRGGIGKTALACRFLKSLEHGLFPDDLGEFQAAGIVYLSVRSYHALNLPNLFSDLCKLLPSEIASQLQGVYRDPSLTIQQKIGALAAEFPPDYHGQIAVNPVVVLLDNFEDLISNDTHEILDSELEEGLRALLDAPEHRIRLIMTTRVAPRDIALYHPECQTRLDMDHGLPLESAVIMLHEMDSDGRLGLRDCTTEILGQACQRTQGFPRALEALVAILTTDRFTTLEELVDVQSDLPENVVAAFVGEAFSRLDSFSQQVMQALAIYNRPVHPAAVDYLLKLTQTPVNSTPTLNRLVATHFARRERGRYFLHPADREYAIQQLSSEGSEWSMRPLLLRAAGYCNQSRKPQDEWQNLGDLEAVLAEIELLCAAQEWYAAAAVINLINYDYLHLWGYYRLIISLNQGILTNLSDPHMKSLIMTHMGHAFISLGDVRRAIGYYESSLTITRQIGHTQGIGANLGSLGSAYYSLGESRQAKDLYLQALELARKSGDRRSEGADLACLGQVSYSLGEVQLAVEYYQQALDIAREIGDIRWVGSNLGNLGISYANLGKPRQAIDCYQQALAIARQIGNRLGESVILNYLGAVYFSLSDLGKAENSYEHALTIAQEIGNRHSEASNLNSIARIRVFQGKVQQAVELGGQALEIAQAISDRRLEAILLTSLANAHHSMGELDETIENNEKALKIFMKIGDRHWQGICMANLGLAYIDQGQTSEAIDNYQQAIEIARQVEDRSSECKCLSDLGQVYANIGESIQAIDTFDQAIALARQINSRYEEGNILTYQAFAFLDQDNLNSAQHAANLAVEISEELSIEILTSRAYRTLAMVCQSGDDLQGALAAARNAIDDNNPWGSRQAMLLLGVTTLTLGDSESARQAFQTSKERAENLLERSPRFYAGLDAKALALCGLALIAQNSTDLGDPSALISQAKEAYQAARAINSEKGVKARARRLFEQLARADSDGLLAEIRNECF